MDSVRFGRALGIGARLAAKTAASTLVTAVDAATAPNPSPKRTPATAGNPVAAPAPPRQASSTRPTAVPSPPARSAPLSTVRDTSLGIARGSRQFGRAVWGPAVRLSGVLWLELTGVFFGLFAFSAGVAAWKLRGNLHLTPANATSHTHLLLALAVATIFGYFCASSFIRANRRGRRP